MTLRIIPIFFGTFSIFLLADNISILWNYIKKNKITNIILKSKMISFMENKDDIQVMLENAVCQQLFNGQQGDRIMGKNPENTMQITGIGDLLDKFIKNLRDNLSLLKENKVSQFIGEYEKQFKLDLSETRERIEANFLGMGGIEVLAGQETVIYYMVLTKLLEALRETAYNQFGLSQIKTAFQEQNKKSFDKNADAKLQNLAAMNEENISLLYNLSFVAMLANIYGDKKFLITVKRLVSIRVNRILPKII